MTLQTENLFKRAGFDNPNGGSPFREDNIKGEAGKGKGQEAGIVNQAKVKCKEKIKSFRDQNVN